MTTILRFAIKIPPIPVTVDTSETRRPKASPKVTAVPVLRFATTTPPIPVTVDTFATRSPRSDHSPAFRDHFNCQGMRDTRGRFANALRTRTQRLLVTSWTPGPNLKILKTGTLLWSIQEKNVLVKSFSASGLADCWQGPPRDGGSPSTGSCGSPSSATKSCSPSLLATTKWAHADALGCVAPRASSES